MRRRTTRRRSAWLGAVALGVSALLGASVTGASATPDDGRAQADQHSEVSAQAHRLPAPPRPQTQPVRGHTALPASPLTWGAAARATPTAPSAAGAGGSSVTGGLATGAPTITTTATAQPTLVLYDTTNTYGWLGELYAEQTANLVSHFGAWTAQPVTRYTAGQLADFGAVVYIGSTYDEPLPAAFLSDVLATTKPVLWMGFNIWQLTNGDPTFTADYGWNWTGLDFSTVNAVSYRGQTLSRDGVDNQGGIMNVAVSDPSRATTLASAVRADGTTFPWATRSRNLTYVGEIPYAYEGMSDRYLALSDLYFDLLAPSTATRHRALVRIEDVGPDADPADLRAVADTLSAMRVPFTFGVFPVYKDPRGFYNNGVPVTRRLRDVPAVVSAIKYMISKGGTMIDHGYTHQYSNVSNPYDGVSGDDFEFYRAHVDASNAVVFDGPVPTDSATYAANAVSSAAAEFRAAGLPVPTVWEFPHYAGSAVDYQTIGRTFATRYERSLYFGGQLSGGPIDYSRMNGQFFPYVVKDLYGTTVIPENIGNDEPLAYNTNPPRHPADIIASARANLVVRDGFASFFFHPYLMSDTADGTTGDLRAIVTGIRQLGYTFIASTSLTSTAV